MQCCNSYIYELSATVTFFSLIGLFIQCEHARLDSMVLLLMKLDQLDQEIENALSVSSSMDSTPNLHRRQLVNICMLPCWIWLQFLLQLKQPLI